MKLKIIFGVIIFSLIGIGFAFWNFQTKQDEAKATLEQISSKQASNQVNSNNQIDSTNRVDSKKIYQFNSLEEYEQVSKYGKLPSFFEGRFYFPKLTDSKGNLIISSDIINVIDFFYLASKEEDKEKINGRIREYFMLTLQDKAANEALSIFEDYLKYKEAVAGLNTTYETTSDKIGLFQKLKALRRQYFKPDVVEALYQKEETKIEYLLQKSKILEDDSIGEERKDEMVSEIEEQLPEKEREQYRRERKEQNFREKLMELQEKGGSAEEIYALRKGFYGKDTADKITFMLDYSDEWEKRVEDYEQTIDQIHSNPDLTNEEIEKRIEDAKNKIFTEKERAKLAYYYFRKEAPPGYIETH